MSDYMWGDNETQFFFNLTPDIVLDAVDALGFKTSGRCLALNSMENRVYEVEIEVDESQIKSPSDKFVIAKFYRPGRWSEQQIRDEHQFMMDLNEVEVPVVSPLSFDGETLFKLKDSDLWYTLFPKKGGRVPEEMNEEQLEIMGRMLARLHNVGEIKSAQHRINISPETYGIQNLKFLIDNKTIPPQYEQSYKMLVEKICELSAPLFANVKTHRIHGDCHWGNIIWREQEGPFFIDFDDMLVGPAVQDIWLVVPGRDQYALQDRAILLESYQTMREFDHSTLKLIEPLRTLRFIHFTAWTAKRWEDPAFKKAFPDFGSERYWEVQINDLREQLGLISELNQPY